jgi:hypothetical protein
MWQLGSSHLLATIVVLAFFDTPGLVWWECLPGDALQAYHKVRWYAESATEGGEEP